MLKNRPSYKQLILLLIIFCNISVYAKVIKVEDFGANPNDKVNDALKIQLAIDVAQRGDTLIFSKGTYKLEKPIIVNTDGLTLKGSGTIFSKQQPSQEGLILRSDWSKVVDISIDGAKKNLTKIGGSGVIVEGSNNTLTRLIVYQNQGHGILFKDEANQSTSCHSNRLNDSIIIDNNEVGVAQNHCTNNTIDANTIKQSGNEGITIDVGSHGAHVKNNVLIESCLRGGVGGIGVDASHFSVIQNNTILNSQNYCGGIKTQNNIDTSDNNSIEKNYISENSGVAIWLNNNSGRTSNNTSVVGNTIVDKTSFAKIENTNGNSGNTIQNNTVIVK